MHHLSQLRGYFIAASLVLLSTACRKQNFTPTTEPQLVLSASNDTSLERLGANGLPEPVAAGLGIAHMAGLVLQAQRVELLEQPDGGRTTVLFELPPQSFGGISVLPNRRSLRIPDRFFHVVPLEQISSGNYNWIRITPLTISDLAARLQYDSIQAGGTRLPLLATGYLMGICSNNTLVDTIMNFRTVLGTNLVLQRGDLLFTGQAITATQATVPINLLSVLRLAEPSLIGSAGAPNSRDLYLKIENGPLRIGSRETKSIYLDLTLGVNHSMEWTESNGNQLFEPAAGEQILRMGTRGGKALITAQ